MPSLTRRAACGASATAVLGLSAGCSYVLSSGGGPNSGAVPTVVHNTTTDQQTVTVNIEFENGSSIVDETFQMEGNSEYIPQGSMQRDSSYTVSVTVKGGPSESVTVEKPADFFRVIIDESDDILFAIDAE